jgi:hypothetical protein
VTRAILVVVRQLWIQGLREALDQHPETSKELRILQARATQISHTVERWKICTSVRARRGCGICQKPTAVLQNSGGQAALGRFGNRTSHTASKFFACLRGQSAVASSDQSNDLASISLDQPINTVWVRVSALARSIRKLTSLPMVWRKIIAPSRGMKVKRRPRAYAALLAKPINEAPKHEPPTFRVSSAHFVIRNISMAEGNHSLLSFRVEGECYDRLQPTGSF